ncbi:MAG: DEAD/DEAH box helicase [Chlamydiae bacterium]|nr:DEAD/DEAH box helicase [Chlamydiota bacterium]MBI3277954.1 DEAD/DEAH box helicase [Chlamydiota bacterium]
MFLETSEDTYKAYQRFLKRGEYRKAYRALEKLLHAFSDDTDLLEEMIDFCLLSLKKPELAKPWLLRLIKIRGLWIDYALLCQIETNCNRFSQAKGYLKKAKELQKTQRGIKPRRNPKRFLSDLEDCIQFQENRADAFADQAVQSLLKEVQLPHQKSQQKRSSLRIRKADPQVEIKPPKSLQDVSLPSQAQTPVYKIPVKIEFFQEESWLKLFETEPSSLKEYQLWLDYSRLAIQRGFDELLCLQAMQGVEKYRYQIETVKKVLKHFHGRALLCDEVGLGKTIEAGMLIREYLSRGMVKNVLILTPSSLVSQWAEEMQMKFGLEFKTTSDGGWTQDPANFWKQKLIIASIHTAKRNQNAFQVVEQFYDLVIVDEAHHLRNRTTLAWQFVNQIKKKFIFLLTATPVQNNLIELFNLITLLKPGQFKTEKIFRQEYLPKGNEKALAHQDKLRGLLRDVMIRNTRSAIDLKLPKRFATTIRLESSPIEKEIYTRLNDYLSSRKEDLSQPMIYLLLREAGSSPFALKSSLQNMLPNLLKSGNDPIPVQEILEAISHLQDSCKGRALIELLQKKSEDKKVIFTQYLQSMNYVMDLLERCEIPYVTFRGDHSAQAKEEAITRFKNDVPVLISTESGGEGRNMQFCNTLINFDIPWNPMRIEQRIGRLHRIGQTRDVFIFNLSIKETIEDYILDILENKINLFEMVIGEIEPILGHRGEDKDFEEVIMEIWMKGAHPEHLKSGFEELGTQLINAKGEYLKSQSFVTKIFGEDYEI